MNERPHGTRARYVFGPTGNNWRNGCRCFECSQAAVLYEKRRVAARRRGEPAYIDAAEARHHLLWLRANGIGRRTIEAATGLSNSTTSKIASGKVTRIRPATADKILGVHLGKGQPGSNIDASRTHAQIDDLVNVVGMTRGAIAQALGAQTRALQVGKKGQVTRATADKVDALWREQMTPIHAGRERAAEARAYHRARKREQAST